MERKKNKDESPVDNLNGDLKVYKSAERKEHCRRDREVLSSALIPAETH